VINIKKNITPIRFEETKIFWFFINKKEFEERYADLRKEIMIDLY
jgi:hypothetical protein